MQYDDYAVAGGSIQYVAYPLQISGHTCVHLIPHWSDYGLLQQGCSDPAMKCQVHMACQVTLIQGHCLYNIHKEMNDISIVSNNGYYENLYYHWLWSIHLIIRNWPHAYIGSQLEACPVASSTHVKGGHLHEKKWG